MDNRALYDLAEQQNIEVRVCPLPKTGSLSVLSDTGRCWIGMDDQIPDSSVQERVHLAHELGHCITGSFYNIHATVDHRQRHENRADKWAVQQLISVDALDDAVAEGCTELWALAERFGVSEAFMKKAVCYYVHGNMAAELYF